MRIGLRNRRGSDHVLRRIAEARMEFADTPDRVMVAEAMLGAQVRSLVRR